MPYPNWHASRQREPGEFVGIKMLWEHSGIQAYGGRLKSDPNGGTEIQTLRFDKDKWTPERAKEWLKSHNYKEVLEVAKVAAESACVLASDELGPFIPLGASKGFTKVVAKVKKYVKGDEVHDITAERLQHWANVFAEMHDNGVKVPMPLTHAGAGDPEKNAGFVEGMWVEGDTLLIKADIVADKEKLVESNDVSIFAPGIDIKDGEGHIYSDPITHIALTPIPLFPGLGEFVAIAAEQVPVFAAMKPVVEVDPKLAVLEASLVSASTKIAELEASLTSSNAKYEALEASLKVDDVTKLRLEALVKEGKLQPVFAGRLSKLIVDPKKPLVAQFVDVLERNKPVSLGGKTGRQQADMLQDDLKSPGGVIAAAERIGADLTRKQGA